MSTSMNPSLVKYRESIRMDALKDLCGKHLAFSMPDSAEVLNKVLRDFATANNDEEEFGDTGLIIGLF